MSAPRLLDVRTPRHPRGVVLLIHGGGSRSGQMMVSPTQLSVLRMIPVARRVAGRVGNDVAVLRLLNSYRGWDAKHTPVHDIRWALDQMRDRYGDVPVCLIGHSLGGRAAIQAATADAVVGVVALNAYILPADIGAARVRDRRLLFVHGDEDRIAPRGNAAALADRLSATNEVEFVTVAGGKHAMLRHHREFEQRAAAFAAALLGQPSLD